MADLAYYMLSIKSQTILVVHDLIHDADQGETSLGVPGIILLSTEMKATLDEPGLMCGVDQQADQPG